MEKWLNSFGKVVYPPFEELKTPQIHFSLQNFMIEQDYT